MGHPMTLPRGLDELWGYEPSARGRARGGRADQPGPGLARRPWRRACRPRSRSRGTASLFPAPRQRWVDELSLSARRAGRDRRAGPAHPRHARSHRAAARRRARPARRAARRPRAPLRRRRPRHAARTHRRIQPTSDDLPGDRPMTDFAVLRTPSQVLFGAGMAAAAGRVAAGHGRRVLVITDPVIAETPGFATVLESLADLEVAVFQRRRRRRAALGGRRRGGRGPVLRAGRDRRRRRRQRDRPGQGHRAAARARRRAGGLLRAAVRARARSSR